MLFIVIKLVTLEPQCKLKIKKRSKLSCEFNFKAIKLKVKGFEINGQLWISIQTCNSYFFETKAIERIKGLARALLVYIQTSTKYDCFIQTLTFL